jgi:hypothetical protein
MVSSSPSWLGLSVLLMVVATTQVLSFSEEQQRYEFIGSSSSSINGVANFSDPVRRVTDSLRYMCTHAV